jgi:DNA-binding NarL/FixJ family response regulator
LIRSALVGASDPLSRARLLTAHVEIAVAAGDQSVAEAAADELDEVASIYGSSGLHASAKRARGAVLLAAGRLDEALATLRDACSGWYELDAPHDCAKVRVLLARTYRELGDTESAERELAAARSAFAALGAALDASQLGEHGRTPPRGLTDREAQVLALVAVGSTNRQIATELHLSQKTVERHVSNIFSKIEVTTRTAAARFAFEHGIAAPEHG